MKTALPEFDPVVSILIRELAHLPSLVETDNQAHQYLKEKQPEYYSILLRLAQEIRHEIRREVANATTRFAEDSEQEIYNHAIDDCLNIIETRGETPL